MPSEPIVPPTIREIVAENRAHPIEHRVPPDWPRDEHGLPIVEADPNDPDDNEELSPTDQAKMNAYLRI